MMRFTPIFILVVISFISCSLFDGFTKRNLTFTENGITKTERIVLPTRIKSVNNVNSDGISGQVFEFRDGEVIYFVHAEDSSWNIQPIRYENNIPKELYGGRYWKGVDSSGSYWRESRYGNFKMGYFNVGKYNDWRFDSALNYFHLLRYQ